MECQRYLIRNYKKNINKESGFVTGETAILSSVGKKRRKVDCQLLLVKRRDRLSRGRYTKVFTLHMDKGMLHIKNNIFAMISGGDES